jgi:hypothetical protein
MPPKARSLQKPPKPILGFVARPLTNAPDLMLIGTQVGPPRSHALDA